MNLELLAENYDANNDAEPVTYWDMALGNDIEDMYTMIRSLQISVDNLRADVVELKRQLREVPNGHTDRS